jgi:RNA polymerase sigma-70 factor, ECF subfamily
MTIPVSGSCTDELLVAQARKGDVRAFERLYRDHLGRVYGLCLRMTGNVAQAEDCTQQAFIKAWGALRGFEARSTFATWMHLPLEPLEETADEALFETPIEVAEIEAAIASLPSGARDVLVLVGIYGHSHTEAAQMLGVAEGTCKAQLHRARQLLRNKLEMEGE